MNKWAVLAALVMVLLLSYGADPSPADVQHDTLVPGTYDLPKAVGGKVTGGPFSLTDHLGRPASDTDFRGQFMLIYFGYMSCPDVCPKGLQVVTEAMDVLGPAAGRVQPLFITFDPDRDTVALLADFVDNFHPRLLGLTGTKEQTLAAANSYDVDVSATYAAGNNLDYSMNHSAFTYLSGPDGKLRMMFRDGIDGKTMASFIVNVMNKETRSPTW